MGAVPPQLAGLIQTKVNVQAMTVEAAHTAAEFPLAEIHRLVDLLLEAYGEPVPTPS